MARPSAEPAHRGPLGGWSAHGLKANPAALAEKPPREGGRSR